jgi:hypothetical protein
VFVGDESPLFGIRIEVVGISMLRRKTYYEIITRDLDVDEGGSTVQNL